MKKRLLFFIILFSILSIYFTAADNIRGKVVKHILLTDSSSTAPKSFSMSIEEVFAVSFDKNSSLISGFEIEVTMSPYFRDYSGSFAVNLYKKISPEISSGIGTYYGKKYDSFILPDASKFYIQIPYNQRLNSKNSLYTKVFKEVIDYKDSPVMVTILPIMKGFPSSLYNSSLSFKVRPIFKESGSLDITLAIPEDLDKRQLELSINGGRLKVVDNKAGIALPSGRHNLNIEIPGGKSINRYFEIKAGENLKLNLKIEKLESFATIDVPENTTVYIDGERLANATEKKLSLEPGVHTVLFKIGDYKISKKFDILPGKDCKISLFLDIFVEEN